MKKVAKRTAPKYTFYGFTADDMEQEAYIECIQVLDKYKPEIAPLEHFLANHLSKRMLNVIRKYHFQKSDKEDKKRVAMPGQLSNEESMRFYEIDSDQEIDTADMIEVIDKHLPSMYRENYLKLINDVHVEKKQRDELIEIIQEIVEEHGYDE